MLMIRGELLNVRTASFTDRTTGETKQSHYLQILTQFPASGSGFGDEVKLPPDADLLYWKELISRDVQFAVRAFVVRDRLYLSLMNPQPDGDILVFPDDEAA